jgi:hypothetical protein
MELADDNGAAVKRIRLNYSVVCAAKECQHTAWRIAKINRRDPTTARCALEQAHAVANTVDELNDIGPSDEHVWRGRDRNNDGEA